jgi:hypothetical protein
MSVTCEMCKRASDPAPWLLCEAHPALRKSMEPYCEHYLERALEKVDADMVVA